MKVLVTGGAGFIGSHLVKILIDSGEEVTILDDFSVGRMQHLDFVRDKIKIVTGSIHDINTVKQLMSGKDKVYHLAVKCLVACNENPTIAHQTNVSGTFNICLAAYETHTKIIYISSSEVYGTCQQSPMTEKHPTQPQSIYGLSKLLGEEYVRFFHRHYGVPAVIIRSFNAYGPHHRNDQYAAVITKFIQQLDKGKYPVIEGTGEQCRDFTYVTDIAEGILLLSNLEHGETVNLGSGNAVTIKQLATTLMEIYNVKKIYNYVDHRPNDVFKLEAGVALAISYGYAPKVSLVDGLIRYIRYMDWLKNGGGSYIK